MFALIDILIIAVVIAGFISGILQGLVVQAGMLAGLFLAIWGARIYTGVMAGYLDRLFEVPDTYLPALSFICCFLLILLCISVIVRLLHKFFHLVALGWLDHTLGGILGGLKSILLLSVLIFVLNVSGVAAHIIPQEQIEKSTLYEPVRKAIYIAFMGNDPKEYWDRFKIKPEKAESDIRII